LGWLAQERGLAWVEKRPVGQDGCLTGLFGQNQPAVFGDAQAIVLASMSNQDFLLALE
jgi:hypothetical protein